MKSLNLKSALRLAGLGAIGALGYAAIRAFAPPQWSKYAVAALILPPPLSTIGVVALGEIAFDFIAGNFQLPGVEGTTDGAEIDYET